MYPYLRRSRPSSRRARRQRAQHLHTQTTNRTPVRAANPLRSPLGLLVCLLFLCAAVSLLQIWHAVSPPAPGHKDSSQASSTASPGQSTTLTSTLDLASSQSALALQREKHLLAQAAERVSQHASTHRSASSSCASGSRSYVVVAGDTLSGIATHFGTTWTTLVSFNHLADPNIILVDQTICIPGTQAPPAPVGPTSIFPTAPSSQGSSRVVVGTANLFHYGQCTWWADQRYYQLHGVFVPWMVNSDAWLWTQRAYEFGWHVSSTPSPGAIIDLQPWVQGAYSGGHVAVVEQVLSNGDVLASTMNWGKFPFKVQDVEFAPGPGVTFISS